MPRKPKQRRSKATVDAILEAGFICVARHGHAHTTTRRVAEIAGIGVGSLYEYFSNKEALFEALHHHFVQEVVAMIEGLMPELVTMEIASAIELLLLRFGELLKRNDERYLKCVRAAMFVDITEYMAPVSQVLGQLVMQYVMHHPETMRLRDIPTMTYIFINGGIFTVVRHLSDPRPPMTFEALAHGLGAMVGHYVAIELASPDRVAGAPPSARRGT